ncbi:hypothetical protein RRG08_061831 [Elysia crispata]|uniref:Uncharacterized protein n=1 Tax=Elysia crispata TaxID=231223 RepID=A0AAE1A2J1_9GAST|nr:hypothetical protein RRG08_061831 [Elysia crispata]
MILPFTRFWILVLCATCHAQDFRNGKIFDVSEGRVCEPLKKPENGHLVCQSSKGREKCRLVCDPGYTVPMTFTLLNEQAASAYPEHSVHMIFPSFATPKKSN